MKDRSVLQRNFALSQISSDILTESDFSTLNAGALYYLLVF